MNLKLPSFFKSNQTKKFNYKPRYYKPNFLNDSKKNTMNNSWLFLNNKNRIREKEKRSIYRFVFLIIVISLLCYKIIFS